MRAATRLGRFLKTRGAADDPAGRPAFYRDERVELCNEIIEEEASQGRTR